MPAQTTSQYLRRRVAMTVAIAAALLLAATAAVVGANRGGGTAPVRAHYLGASGMLRAALDGSLQISLQFPAATSGSRPLSLPVKQFDMSVQNPNGTGSASGGAGAGKVQYQPVALQLPVSAQALRLADSTVEGSHYPQVNVVLTHRASSNDVEQVVLDLRMVLVQQFGLSGASNGATESVRLLYGAVKLTYTKNGKPAKTQPFPTPTPTDTSTSLG